MSHGWITWKPKIMNKQKIKIYGNLTPERYSMTANSDYLVFAAKYGINFPAKYQQTGEDLSSMYTVMVYNLRSGAEYPFPP